MKNPFSLKGKIKGQTLNNFTILNRDYNIQLEQRNLFFFLFFHFSFSLTALFLIVYLSPFSPTLYVFLFSFIFYYSRSSSRLHQSSHSGTSLNDSTPIGPMAFLFLHLFLSFLPSSCLASLTSHFSKCKPTCLDFCT